MERPPIIVREGIIPPGTATLMEQVREWQAQRLREMAAAEEAAARNPATLGE